MRISDWSSDVCSSDLVGRRAQPGQAAQPLLRTAGGSRVRRRAGRDQRAVRERRRRHAPGLAPPGAAGMNVSPVRNAMNTPLQLLLLPERADAAAVRLQVGAGGRILTGSEEHTSELQSLMRISYAVFCLKKKKKQSTT